MFLLGVAGFCVGVVLASDETVQVFLWNNTLKETLSDWLLYVKIGVAIGTAVMVILSVLFLAMAYLGTGATRKEFICRFRTRATGRCQTAVVMTVSYVLLLIWLIILLITLIPTFFFSIQAAGICRSARDSDQLSRYYYECLDLRQWGLIDYNQVASDWADPRLPAEGEEDYFMCDDDLDKMCDSDVLIFYGVTLAAAIIVVISLVHYVLNFSANYAKLRDRFKDGYVDKRTGTYLQRTASLRGSKRSLAGTKASLRGSRASVRNLGASGMSNGAVLSTTSGSTVKNGAYRNDALKSSREDLNMHELKLANLNGGYSASNYAGSNYGGSNYTDSNYGGSVLGSGLVGSTYGGGGGQDYKGPAETIDEIPNLKAAYIETFDNEAQESYNQRDTFPSQVSYEANVPVDPYVSANINNGGGYGKPDAYRKSDGYGQPNGMRNNMSQNADSYNEGYGSNLDRNWGNTGKEYGSNRPLGANDNELAMHSSYSGINQAAPNRNSQGSTGAAAGGFAEPYVTLQSSDDSPPRDKQEYFI
eukprot:XP_794526.3 PREDICTED: uncharacterized protein LOC589799 [Strongylocentrotus purpuratus]